MSDTVPSAAQIRSGRALLGWSQDQLAQASKTSRRTIATYEGDNSVSMSSILAMQDALMREGIEFLGDGSDEGVRRIPK